MGRVLLLSDEQPLPKKGKIKGILKSDKTKIIAVIGFLILIISLNFSFFIRQKITPHSYFVNINDADRLSNGSTIVQVSEMQTALRSNDKDTEEWESVSGLLEIDQDGNIIWEFFPDGVLHHVDHEIVQRDDGYFFCDCIKDAIKFVRKSTKEIEWTYRLEDINWTQINASWGAEHYYNLPCNQNDTEECIDWSHLNDIDFKDYGSWESMLVSIRNFNLIIEVNYTRASQRETAVAEDIVWYYTGNLSHQHDPDYLPNGNLLIVDSNNQKLIEVNMTTKEIVWEWTHASIRWPRDCDVMPDNRLLITDIDKVLIINRTSGVILQIFSKIVGGYEADYIASTNTILVSSGSSGVLYELDCETEKIVWKWGSDVLKQITYSNCLICIFYELFWILVGFQIKSKWRWLLIITLLAVIGFELYLMIGYYHIAANLFTRAVIG